MSTLVLVVEDHSGMRRTLELVLEKGGFRVATLASGEQIEETLGRLRPDIVITDLKMEPVSGIEVLRRVRMLQPHTPVIIITAFGTIDSAVESMKLGAVDFLAKPFRNEDLLMKVQMALERRGAGKTLADVVPARTEPEDLSELVAGTEGMKEVTRIVERVASSGLTVLITGETGTGKTLLARIIHRHSAFANGRFVQVNVAALPEPLLESELFGHEKGAFTGASASRKGLVEEADRGTLFLDEIGAMPANLQAKLLAVLQDRELRRIGSNRVLPINVRVIAATNTDLDAAVARGEFRRDLYYRLNVARIHIPPLRERAEDIPHLVQRYLDAHARRVGRLFSVDPAAMKALVRYPYPGNVRELQNAIEWMMTVTTSDVLMEKDLPAPMRRRDAAGASARGEGRTLDEHEREVIVRAIETHQGTLAEVARSLGIGRTTLWRKMREYGLQR